MSNPVTEFHALMDELFHPRSNERVREIADRLEELRPIVLELDPEYKRRYMKNQEKVMARGKEIEQKKGGWKTEADRRIRTAKEQKIQNPPDEWVLKHGYTKPRS